METTSTNKYSGVEAESEADSEQDENQEHSCPDCGNDIVKTGTELVCKDCGLVVSEDEIDHGPDWRNHNNENEPARASRIDTTRSDNGLGAQIGWKHSPTRSSREGRLQRASKFASADGQERRQGKAIGDIKQTASAIELPDHVSDQACKLFKRYHNNGDRTGISFEEMVAGAIFVAARVNQSPIQPEDLTEQLGITRKKVFYAASDIADDTGLSIPLQSPHTLVPRIITELNGETKTETLARKMARTAEEENLHNGLAPSSVAGAVVYEAFLSADWEGKRKTQKEVAEAASISTVTVRNTWNTLKEEGINGSEFEVIADE